MPKKIEDILRQHVPRQAVSFCAELYHKNPFLFKVTRSRKTKLGDFRFQQGAQHQTISINHDLSPYSFLITYLHEYAHLVTFLEHGPRVQPHGKEWKFQFQQLLTESLSLNAYPDDLIEPLLRYISNPKATTHANSDLYLALAKYNSSAETLLRDISNLEYFTFRGEAYQKISKRRTRSLCRRSKDQRDYLISELAPVSRI